ncbi:hypothetical protein GIB67_038860 [Kingdonia uniflora]|uniref:Uncharacterized protein n=1 Tax=Kingdonia uniflora TaxID=39325 RepID=A0A7J7MSC9_9MAGN|nr:hypothetical protein GIB67_038860 [Kingdonia uniflora]
MERFLHSYEKDSMKMVILKHEQTFKEQVYELHRLYRVQKTLMRNTKSSKQNFENRISSNGVDYINQEQRKAQLRLDLECPAEEHIDEDEEITLEIEDESDIKLTLGPTRSQRMKNVEKRLNFDMGESLSSSTESRSSQIPRASSTRQEWGIIQVPRFHSGRTDFDVDDEHLRQERLNRPPWLFQALSLNMT